MIHLRIYDIIIVIISFWNFLLFPAIDGEHWTSKSNKFHFTQISMYKTMII